MMVVKIGRHEYEITDNDLFMDNGVCVQLMTQSKEKSTWGRRPSPLLSKKLVREMEKLTRIARPHKYGSGIDVFSFQVTAYMSWKKKTKLTKKGQK